MYDGWSSSDQFLTHQRVHQLLVVVCALVLLHSGFIGVSANSNQHDARILQCGESLLLEQSHLAAIVARVFVNGEFQSAGLICFDPFHSFCENFL